MAIEVFEKPKIKTKKLNIQLYSKGSSDTFVESLDYVPYIFLSKLNDPNPDPIEGTTIDPKDIIYFKLFNSRFVPEMELFCNDSKGILFNDMYPLDHDTILSIFVKSNSDDNFPIRMDFRITEYETIKYIPDSKDLKYLIKGILDLDDLHFTRYESRRGTSYNIIKDIALQMNLGWASNVKNSDDEMTWINPSDTYREFIKDITKYAFVNENSFVWTAIDLQYNLNYIDIQSEMNNYLNEEQSLTITRLIKNDEQRIVPLYLTNNNAFNMTNKYISKFDILNQSFKVNLDKFYRMKGTWYNKNENTVYKQFVTEFESDQTKLSSGDGQLLTLIDKQSKLYSENINDEYFIGKIDTDNNVHKNYALAKVLNKYNLDAMQKMSMVITLNQLNFSIKRFQNIRIEIYNPMDLLSRDADERNPLDNINKRLSGFWYVTGINYMFRKDGGNEQEITLVRRDLSLDYGKGTNERNDFRKFIKNK